MATGADLSQPLTLMERDGLQTAVHTSSEGNVVVPEGGSFLESLLIAKVAVEETCKEQETYQTKTLSFQSEKKMPENEKEIVEEAAAKENEVVDKTKERAEKSQRNSEVVDNIETIPRTAKIEEPCLNIGEEESPREEKILEHVEEDLNRQASVEERPGSIKKDIHGSERNEDEVRKIDQSDEHETGKEVSMCHSGLHQSQEAFQTADVAINKIDSGVKTETQAFQESESKDNARGDTITSVDDKQIGEERFEGVEGKSESSFSFLDEKKALDATKPIENIENEKEGTECRTIDEGSSFVKESPDILNGEEAISKVGEHVQDKLDRPHITESTDNIQEDASEGGDKLEQDASMTCKEARQETINLSENIEDMIRVINKTQEKLPIDSPSVTQTEEIEAQKVYESELHIVSETGLEDIVKKSPQKEGKTLTPEETAEAGGIGGENVRDEMNPEEKVDALIVENEESKQRILEEPTTTEASDGESREIGENPVREEPSADDSRDTGENTVLAAEDNVNDAVTITTQEHSEIAATTEASAEECRETGENTVIATEDNLSDAVPITTTEHCVIAAEEKIGDAITTVASENNKEETSKHDNNQEDSSTLQDEPERKEIDNSLKIIPKEIDTALSESSEANLSAKEDRPTKIKEETSGDKRESEPVGTGTIIDNVIPKEKDLPSKELDENIEGAEVEIQSKNSNDLHITHSVEQETIQAEDENLQKVSGFGPQEQFQEANGASEDLEKHVANAAEVLESTENILDPPSVEHATRTELSSKPSEKDIEKLEEVHEMEPEEKLEIDDAGTKIEEEMQNKEEVHDLQTHKQATTGERTEEVITDEVCNAAPFDEKVEQSSQAENLQEAETLLRNEIEDNCKSDILNEEVHDEPKVTGIGEVTDEKSIKDNGAHLALEDVDQKIVETSQDTEKEAEMSKGEEAEEKIMEEYEAILQESIKEAPVENFQHDEQNSDISTREISAEFEAAKTIETENNDGSHNTTQTSLTIEQECLQAESQKPAEEEINEVGSPIRNDKDKEINSGLAEVEENNSKETLKGGEDLVQMSQVSETGENLEHSVNLLSAETEADVLSKVTNNTEEDAPDFVENNMMEAKVVKEDIKEQIIDESNMKYVDQVPVNNLQTDQMTAETSNREIFEESETSGTDASIAHETDQIAESPSTATLVNEVESVEGEDIEKSDKESSETIDGTDHETNQNSEITSLTLETLRVKEEESLQTEHLTPAEASPVDKKHEDGSIKKDEDTKNNVLPEKTEENCEETLNGEENLEEIYPNNESEENPEQSVRVIISAETETATFSKTAGHQDIMVDIPQGSTKEEEMTKEEDTDGQNIESNIKSVSQECVEEYPVENSQHDEKNPEKSNIGIFEESQISGGGESTAHEPNQNDESPESSLSIPLVKEEEGSKDEVENVIPIDASICEKEEDGILENAGEGNASSPEIIDINENSKREILKVEEDLEQESQLKGEIEQSSVVTAAETEANPSTDEMDDITSTKEVSSIQNIDKNVEKEKDELSENIDVIEVKKGNLEEDLKLVAQASDISKNKEIEVENLITRQKEVEMLEKKFVLDTKQELEGKEAGENIEEEIKEVYQDNNIAWSSEDTEKHIKAEEHTGIYIPPQSTGDETDLISKEDEKEAKTEKELCEEVVTSRVDEDTETQVSDEESNTNDQSAGPTGDFVHEYHQSGTLPKQEVHEITQIVKEVEDIGNQENEISANFEVPLIREYEQNLVNLERTHESTKMKLKEEVADLDSKSIEQNEEQDSVEKQELETLKDKQEPNSSLYLMEASEEEAIIKDRNESLVESPWLEPLNTEENPEKAKPEIKDSSPASVDGLTSETILKEGEPEDKIQIESFQLASQEKGPVTMDTEGTTDKIVDVDAKSEDAFNSGEIKDHGIPAAAAKPEKIEHEMQLENPTVRSEYQKADLGKKFDDNLHDSGKPEDRIQIESFQLASQEKGPVTMDTEGTTDKIVDIDAKSEDACNSGEIKDHGIPADAAKPEKIEHEMQVENPTVRSDDQKVDLGKKFDDNLHDSGEPEDKMQIESFQLASQEKGTLTMDTEGTTDEIVNVDAKSEDACNSGEIKDHGIPAAAAKPEKIEHEIQVETPTIGSEDQKVVLGKKFDDNLHDSRESELTDNEASKTADENAPMKENLETPAILQEKEPAVKEDASEVGEMDTERESTNEEARSYKFEDLNKQQEPGDEEHIFEDKEVLNNEEARDIVNQEGILENEDSIKPGDEALKSIKSISTERKEAILEEKESSEKYNKGMTETVEVEKAALKLEAGINDQEQATDAKNYEVLAEENLQLAESDKKSEHVSETEKTDQTSEAMNETNCSNLEDTIEIQNDSSESVEKISQEFQEVQQKKEENPELKLETEDHMKEKQTTEETIKDVILTEEVHEEIKIADSNETIKCTEEKEKDIRELYATHAEDKVKESNLVATEYLKATDSGERTATVSLEVPREPNIEEAAVAKENVEAKVEAEDTSISAAVPTTATAEELEETKKIIDKEDSCSDKMNETTVVEIAAETGLEKAQLDEKPAQISYNDSNDTISHTTEAEASQRSKIGDSMPVEEHSSNLASELPTDGKNITNERVAPENVDADNVQGSKMASDVADEWKDSGTDELHTSNIKEINDASEIIKPPGAERATEQEVAADQTLLEVISEQHEHGTPATTETIDGNIKDIEVIEGDPRTTEEISLQKEDPREPDISQLKLQSNEDIQNQCPKEVQEEEFEDPDDVKEEIKEVSESVSNSNSQGSEVQKEDETTSGQTALTENSEEQSQTSSVALFSNEKDCEITTTTENTEENIKDVEVPVADHSQDSASLVTTEDTYLQKDETKELEVSGLGVELNTDIQKDSLNEIPVEGGQTLDEASKLQPQECKDKIQDREFVPESEKKTEITGALHETYNVSNEISKEAFESASEFHSNKSSAEREETGTMEKHPEVAVIDLVAEENQNEKTIDATECIHDEVAGEFESTFNARTETSEEAFKSVSEIHGPEALAESEDTEIKENHPEVAATDLVVDENQNERTIDATEIRHRFEKEKQQIVAEEEDANNCCPITLGEETSQKEYEHRAEESIEDESTVKDIQNEELYKEVERADGSEIIDTHQDPERSIEHLHQDVVENKTMKESFPEVKNAQEGGSKMHLENQNDETTFGNGRAEAVTINKEELDEEMSRKDGPIDPAEASKTTQDIHQGEKASETTTQNIEEYVNEEEIPVDEHPQSSSAPKTTEDKSLQDEETKELKVTGLEVELDTDLQKDSTHDFHEQEGRTPDIASASQDSQPQDYEKDIKGAPAGNKMKEITTEELVKSVSKDHRHEILTEPEDTEIQEKLPEVAVTDLASEENQSNTTRDAIEMMHDEFTNEEVTTREKQKIMEENGDAKTCYPITLGEEKNEGNHQIYELKAEESEGHKAAEDIRNEEVISERTSEYLHQDAVENGTIKLSLLDEAAAKNVEDIGTKLHLEKQSDETISGCVGTEAAAINKEELGIDMSEKEGPTGLGKANETAQKIHEVEKSSDSNSEGQTSSEAESLATTETKKDVPQVLLEPITETKQSAEVGESQPGNAIGVVNTQGLEHETDKGTDENNAKEIEVIMSAESAKISLSDMMQRSTREEQVIAKDLTEGKAEAIVSKDETNKAKSDEENEEEGEEHRKNDSGSDAPVMLEASRDIVDAKVIIPHKKSHNILSGVGSKVKHSISKVKKAITGKSSHPKQHLPK